MLRNVYIPSALILASLVACDAQVDENYQGEPFATISGTIVDERSAPVEGDVEVGLLWHGKDGDNYGFSGQAVAVSAHFPASFTLYLHAPPPMQATADVAAYFFEADYFDETCEERPPEEVWWCGPELMAQLKEEFGALSLANIFVTEKGAFAALGDVYPSDEELQGNQTSAKFEAFASAVLGGTHGHVLYVHRNFEEESYVGRGLGRAIDAGYYFLQPKPGSSDGQNFDYFACMDAAGEDPAEQLDCELRDMAGRTLITSLDDIELLLTDAPDNL